MFRLTCCPVCSLIPMITPQVVFSGERREKGGDEENQKSTVGPWDGAFFNCSSCICHRKPFHILHYLFYKQKLLQKSPALNICGRKILPLPAPGVTQPVTFPERNSSDCASRKLYFLDCLKALLSIKGKRRHFRSFPKKARSLLSSRASLGLFISADFLARLAELGRPGGTLAESPR